YDEQASASTLLREEFSKLLKDIEKGNIQAVWSIEFTRLTRDEADTIEIRRLFVKNNIRLYLNDFSWLVY
ncbi:MAG: recombinase family protein, partial [Spirochaetales bacterium]|nr:recombinase family protein [Spirochaetales bacterium]